MSKLFFRYLNFCIDFFGVGLYIFIFIVVFFLYLLFFLNIVLMSLLLLINFIYSLHWMLFIWFFLLLKFHIIHIVFLFDFKRFLFLVRSFNRLNRTTFRLSWDHCWLLFQWFSAVRMRFSVCYLGSVNLFLSSFQNIFTVLC